MRSHSFPPLRRGKINALFIPPLRSGGGLGWGQRNRTSIVHASARLSFHGARSSHATNTGPLQTAAGAWHRRLFV